VDRPHSPNWIGRTDKFRSRVRELTEEAAAMAKLNKSWILTVIENAELALGRRALTVIGEDGEEDRRLKISRAPGSSASVGNLKLPPGLTLSAQWRCLPSVPHAGAAPHSPSNHGAAPPADAGRAIRGGARHRRRSQAPRAPAGSISFAQATSAIPAMGVPPAKDSIGAPAPLSPF
jgi:hypothetical protein